MLPSLLMPDYISQENRRFRMTLSYIFEQISWSCHKSVIVNLACGECWEMEVLLELSRRIIAVDEDEKVVERTKQRYSYPQIEFLVSDARKLPPDIRDVDLVLARHPNIGKDDWKAIYNESYRITRSGGLLISTYYSHFEYNMAQSLIKGTGYKVEVAEENPFGIPYTKTASPYKMGADLFLIAALKRGK